MTSAVAFAPGHISGFFQPIYDETNIYRTGSRGAGFSVSLGAISQVSIEKNDDQKITTYVNGAPFESPLIAACICHLVRNQPLKMTIRTQLDLPIRQGFGMSAASALSVAYAAATCLHIPLENAVKAAHAAEVSFKTGLGDVIGSLRGGFEIRGKPGLPPYGVIKNMYHQCHMVLCVVDKGIATKDVLSDTQKQKTISTIGKSCTDELLEDPSLEHFFALSEEFTRRSGLASDKIIQAIDAAKTYGMASMCMLGTAVFATGDTKKLIEALSEYGKVIVTTIDMKGAQVLTKYD